MMDRSFLGKLRVFGKDRVSLLHRLTTNEMRHLKPGEGLVNIFTNAKGRVVDLVEMFAEEDSLFMLTSPGRAPILKQWIEKYTFIEDVRCDDLTAQYGVIALFGEESVSRLRQLFDWQVEDLSAQHVRQFLWEGEHLWVQRTGTINPARFHLVVPVVATTKFWQLLTSKIAPSGQVAYEMLRIHYGLPAVDKEIIEEYNPHEVGLYPFINFEKGCYIGQEVIARLETYQKVQRQLIGVNLETEVSNEQQWPSASAPIYAGEQLIGQLTSVCFSPQRGHAIGLAVIRKSFAAHSEAVQIRWPDRTVAGRLQPLPFE
jgi:hypothetical protein